MKLTIIVAMTPERVIGRDGGLPWKQPADLARFKQLTMGHPLIMGRKTFQSIGRPLPGRTSIVLSRDASFPDNEAEGIIVAKNLDEALARAGGCIGGDETFIVGGGEVYAQALYRVDRILLTLVQTTVAGDAWFPILNPTEWRLASSESRPRDARNPFDLEFQEYERVESR